MKTNDQLYDEAKEAISELFSDRSVAAQTTRINLETLMDEIQIMVDSLPEDDS